MQTAGKQPCTFTLVYMSIILLGDGRACTFDVHTKLGFDLSLRATDLCLRVHGACLRGQRDARAEFSGWGSSWSSTMRAFFNRVAAGVPLLTASLGPAPWARTVLVPRADRFR